MLKGQKDVLSLDEFNNNKDEEPEDLDHASIGQGDKFQQPRNQRDGGFQQDEDFGYRGVRKDFGYCDSMDRNLESIKIKFLEF
jgi:hypothetical protein